MVRLFGCFLVLMVVAAFIGACSQQPPLEDKNVIILVVDTLRRDRLGVHGSKDNITPCMDQLAREGICFEKAHAPSSWTKPSVASLFSGLYPGRHGVIGDLGEYKNCAHFEQDFTTLAEHMKAVGYQTAAFITNANLISFYHFDQGFDTFVQPAGLAPELLDHAKEWIESHKDQGKYFLYLHMIDPHAPYSPPKEYKDKWVHGRPGPKAAFASVGRSTGIEMWNFQYFKWIKEHPDEPFRFDFCMEELKKNMDNIDPSFTEEKIRAKLYLDFSGKDDPALKQRMDYLISLYDGEVSYVDDALQKFCLYLDRSDESRRSMMVLTSDHGEGFLEHETWGHRYYVHGEEVDIPLVFRIPGPDGAWLKGSHEENVSLVDLYPTLLEMAGLPIPQGLDGTSLWPLMRGKSAKSLKIRPVFIESFVAGSDDVSLLCGKRKLIRSAGKRQEEWKYYNLESDPGELNPLDPEEAGVEGRAMKKAIKSFIQRRTLNFNKKGELGSPSKEEIKQLRDLGYI